MKILFLVSGEQMGIADLEKRTVSLNRRDYELPPGTVLKAGDSVSVDGTEYTAMEFIPPLMDVYSDRVFQSIKAKDASYMMSMAGIGPGSSVIESGIGNGTFSSYLLRAIGPSGSLTGIDLSDRALSTCRKNLSMFFGLDNWHQVKGDIREYSSDVKFDACFLDIPDPWSAVQNVYSILKPGGTLVVYSPNYNQIEKAVVEMENKGFGITETVEILKRNMLVREGKTRPDQKMIGHTAFISFGVRKSGFSIRLR